MKILHYDCFAGISGDMNLAAMIDLGADPDKLRAELAKLNLKGWNLSICKDSKNGIFGTKINVDCDAAHEHEAHGGHCGHGSHDSGGANDDEDTDAHGHVHDHDDAHHAHNHEHESAHNHKHSSAHGHCECAANGVHAHGDSRAAEVEADSCESATHAHHAHRAYGDIKKMIESSALSPRVKRDSIKVFDILARAEAQVHGRPVEEVMFHEVGAVDSIVDIVGAAICLELLGVDKIFAEAVELGGGTVKCAHGILPVPAPATAILSKAFPSKIGGAPHECTTPTGAAILAALADGFQQPIAGQCIATGVGVGHRDCATLPNILRASLYEVGENQLVGEGVESVRLVEFAANIDDMTPEQLAYFIKKLFDAGALDAWQESIVMKKNRLAAKVCALVKSENADAVRLCYFQNSTTLGVREYTVSRHFVPRECATQKTRYGDVRCKVSKRGSIARAKPEFDDCAKIADRTNLPIDIIAQNIIEDLKNG